MRRHIERSVGLGLLTLLVACGAPPEANLTGGDMATSSHWVDLAPPVDLSVDQPDLALPDLAMPPRDLASACTPQTSPCDVICQSCGAGQKCSQTSSTKLACMSDGTVGEGGTCSGGYTNDCAAGNLCLSVGNRQSICRHYCRTDADCSGGRVCDVAQSGSSFKACSDPVTSCDPVKNKGCEGSDGCYLVTSDNQPGCHKQGRGGDGDACSGDYDCKGGLVCVDFGFSYGQLCTLACTRNFDCSSGYWSGSLWPPKCQKSGGSTYGFCVPG